MEAKIDPRENSSNRYPENNVRPTTTLITNSGKAAMFSGKTPPTKSFIGDFWQPIP
jgi:hypothetical protein